MFPKNSNPSTSEDFLPSRDPNTDRLAGQDLMSAMAAILSKYKVALGYAADQKPYDIQVVVVDLSVERRAGQGNPLVIGFPFKSYFVVACSSPTVSANLQYSTQDTYAQGIPLSIKDTGLLDNPVAKGYITNAAQVGGTMTILFSVNTEFRSGSQISVTSGGVSVTTGSSMTPVAKVSVAITATLIVAADSTRKNAIIENIGVNDIYISGTTGVTLDTGASPGFKLAPGDHYESGNQGTIYGIARTAATVVSLNTES